MAAFVQPRCTWWRTRCVTSRLQFSVAVTIACWICAPAPAAQLSKESRHVAVIVWDGMRPDFVTEQNTPALWKLAHNGVTFRNHHSVYPSATMVNGTALVTGVYPGRNGIIANHAYRPDIDPHHAIDVETSGVVKKGDEVSGEKYIAVPTIAELVQRMGDRSAIAASKTVGLLLDRQVARGSSNTAHSASPVAKGQRIKLRGSRSVTLFAGKSLPPQILPSIIETIGPFPSAHLQQDAWTAKVLTDVLWKDGVPALSILWLGEPDLTQHETAPGAPAAIAAIKSADENLSAVLSALDRKNAGDTTDVFVVSDHGFSTISRSIDLRKILNDAGFSAKTESETEPKPGDIMLAGNGGSVLFYVVGHDEKLIRRLVDFLQQSDFAGVIFTKQPMQGTFELEQAMINPPQADHSPDVVMAFRWNDAKNQFGVPGMIDADWQRAAGKGTHATLSHFDMHNMLIAAGPDFKRSEVDDLPSGNVDLAPTILQILGIKPPHHLDGRILSEAMANSDPATATPKPETRTIESKKDL